MGASVASRDSGDVTGGNRATARVPRDRVKKGKAAAVDTASRRPSWWAKPSNNIDWQSGRHNLHYRDGSNDRLFGPPPGPETSFYLSSDSSSEPPEDHDAPKPEMPVVPIPMELSLEVEGESDDAAVDSFDEADCDVESETVEGDSADEDEDDDDPDSSSEEEDDRARYVVKSMEWGKRLFLHIAAVPGPDESPPTTRTTIFRRENRIVRRRDALPLPRWHVLLQTLTANDVLEERGEVPAAGSRRAGGAKRGRGRGGLSRREPPRNRAASALETEDGRLYMRISWVGGPGPAKDEYEEDIGSVNAYEAALALRQREQQQQQDEEASGGEESSQQSDDTGEADDGGARSGRRAAPIVISDDDSSSYDEMIYDT
ncbi:hypothetical protein VTK73DRAFT_1971 [Phialemonium thermophilum]|uniref:Uncharacterized protein n=1 Tax=Phialemonium thermophilum TaxID=223376 RepID=A0ABR3VST5_9PEZI